MKCDTVRNFCNDIAEVFPRSELIYIQGTTKNTNMSRCTCWLSTEISFQKIKKKLSSDRPSLTEVHQQHVSGLPKGASCLD